MDALGDYLAPYKAIVGSLAAVFTMGQMFTGLFICKDIYRQKNTRNIPIMPFLGGIIRGVLNLEYGYILRDSTMIQVNLFGIALNIIYLMVYFKYTEDKVKTWTQLGLSIGFSAVVIAYAQYEDPTLIVKRFGFIITAFILAMIAAPLLNLRVIIAKKTTSGLPFPIILNGTIVTFLWLLYGIILKNNYLVVQNLVLFSLVSFQLGLFVVYPSKPAVDEKVKKSE